VSYSWAGKDERLRASLEGGEFDTVISKVMRAIRRQCRFILRNEADDAAVDVTFRMFLHHDSSGRGSRVPLRPWLAAGARHV
jgi:DNA-directed RNA polymerase specialized sigma24 family protein